MVSAKFITNQAECMLVLSSTYKFGPDDKVSFLRPIFNHQTEKYLLIPVSKLTLSDAKEVPDLEQSLLLKVPMSSSNSLLVSPPGRLMPAISASLLFSLPTTPLALLPEKLTLFVNSNLVVSRLTYMSPPTVLLSGATDVLYFVSI